MYDAPANFKRKFLDIFSTAPVPPLPPQASANSMGVAVNYLSYQGALVVNSHAENTHTAEQQQSSITVQEFSESSHLFGKLHRQLVSYNVQANVLAVVPMQAFPQYSSPTALYSAVTTSLSTSVASGGFAQSLAAAAVALGVSGLSNVTVVGVLSSSPSIILPPTVTPTKSPVVPSGSLVSSSTVARISTGGIIGIVIGAAVVIIFLVVEIRRRLIISNETKTPLATTSAQQTQNSGRGGREMSTASQQRIAEAWNSDFNTKFSAASIGDAVDPSAEEGTAVVEFAKFWSLFADYSESDAPVAPEDPSLSPIVLLTRERKEGKTTVNEDEISSTSKRIVLLGRENSWPKFPGSSTSSMQSRVLLNPIMYTKKDSPNSTVGVQEGGDVSVIVSDEDAAVEKQWEYLGSEWGSYGSATTATTDNRDVFQSAYSTTSDGCDSASSPIEKVVSIQGKNEETVPVARLGARGSGSADNDNDWSPVEIIVKGDTSPSAPGKTASRGGRHVPDRETRIQLQFEGSGSSFPIPSTLHRR